MSTRHIQKVIKKFYTFISTFRYIQTYFTSPYNRRQFLSMFRSIVPASLNPLHRSWPPEPVDNVGFKTLSTKRLFEVQEID